MITLTIIGLGLKAVFVLALIFTALAALIGCSKETGQCSVCTVETIYNGSVLHTSTIEQTEREAKASGNCTSTQDEFKQSLEKEVSDQGLDANVTCKYQ